MSSPGPVVAAHTFGRVLRGRELPWLSVEEVAMPAGMSVTEHGHEGAQLIEVDWCIHAPQRSKLARCCDSASPPH
jgi:hypothetical protein